MFRYLLLGLILLGMVGFTYLIYSLKPAKTGILIRLAGILLLGMVIFDTYLTALPVVLYNNNAILGLKLGTIPVEDFFYLAVVVLVGPSLYEYFIHEKTK